MFVPYRSLRLKSQHQSELELSGQRNDSLSPPDKRTDGHPDLDDGRFVLDTEAIVAILRNGEWSEWRSEARTVMSAYLISKASVDPVVLDEQV